MASQAPDATRALHAEVDLLRTCARLAHEADEILEEAMRRRWPLADALDVLIPLLAAHCGADACHVHTVDEDGVERDFRWSAGGAAAKDGDWPRPAGRRAAWRDAGAGRALVAQILDVAGEPFGTAAVRVPAPADHQGRERIERVLDTWCEELDNFLAAIARARCKQRVLADIAAALRHPIVDRGVQRAVEALITEVPLDDLVLVFWQEDDLAPENVHCAVVSDGERADDAFVREHAGRLLRGDSAALAAAMGIERHREEVLIGGRRDGSVIGRLLVARRDGEFNTFDRDLLQTFAHMLRARVVDFNREWKQLSLSFPRDIVQRLLAEEDYAERHLKPQERDAAVLYCDISGFTRISEQVLGTPALIGHLVNTWSAEVVRIIWETGGVFDKMVGDCVIGLWGPPFFDREPRELCRRAADAARRIRDYTRTLPRAPGLEALRDAGEPVGVATGLNWCPLMVGCFGPNEDYTGFSAGMNNTARLQGLAGRDEILCMEGFVEVYADDAAFGERCSAEVKNVAEPLAYRQLIDR